MIGHDIIDLNYEDRPSRWKEERYWQKVLVQEELDWVKSQENPFDSFLICWAIKEAAYKLVCKIHPQHRFIPKKFIVKYLGNKSATPTFLKTTIYSNFGGNNQKKEIRVFKLATKNANLALLRLHNGRSTPAN